jgi:EmrB/QacA subfamily drug resistance transporter
MSDPTPFTPALRRLLVVTTISMFMALLDSTIVNVALRDLTTAMHADLPTIQWLVTSYLLAMAAMIPVSAWLATRLGARRVLLFSIGLFTAASLACGLSDTVGWLIVFRSIQGVAGIAVPVGSMMVMREAGAALIPRVMTVTSVPIVLAPVFGPTIGGLLLDSVGWRWIFLVNVPVGIIDVLLGFWLIPRSEGRPVPRPDLPELFGIVGGSVALTYGLAEIGRDGTILPFRAVAGLVLGVLLIAGFVRLSLRSEKPLMDIRLFANRIYSAASITNFAVGALVFGAIIVMPLYFQVVRGQDAVSTGLLLIPQGVGVAIGMQVASRLVDRIGGGVVCLVGAVLCLVSTVPFLLLTDHTSYWLIGASMVVRGIGIGGTMMPAMAVAYRAIPRERVQDGTVQLNIGQRIGGSIGTAALTVVLQRQLEGARTPAEQAAGFGHAFVWVLAITALATAPAVLLAWTERRAAPVPVAA